MNQIFAYKTQVEKFWLSFLCNMNQPLFVKRHKMKNFDWIENNLLVHNLLRESIEKQLFTGVL